jgi:IS30 family transposase
VSLFSRIFIAVFFPDGKETTMARNNKNHLTVDNREVIEDGLRSGSSARKIAKKLGVAPSTITREVKKHRTVKEIKKSPRVKLSLRCVHYSKCTEKHSACDICASSINFCRECKVRHCIDRCPRFERVMCPKVSKWPYICPAECTKKARCGFPKCTYTAFEADRIYRQTLSESRQNIVLSEEELKHMNSIIVPLVKQGQSLEAIYFTHSQELDVCLRTAYNYQEKGYLDFAALEMPRKVRLKPRKRYTSPGRERIDRSGRRYDDFLQLAQQDRDRVIQGDSVVGFIDNKTDILTLHILARKFQIFIKKTHADASATVSVLDEIEIALGSPEAFEALFGILLVDRGEEFDDYKGMERSCLVEGRHRCRVFYCDAMNSNQKANAERNHERLRRILPKERSNFDALSVKDVQTCCNHVNSYPLPSLFGQCPFEALGGMLPKDLMKVLGLKRLASDNVVLSPKLMSHAVDQ